LRTGIQVKRSVLSASQTGREKQPMAGGIYSLFLAALLETLGL
jgi:hypothetical protein